MAIQDGPWYRCRPDKFLIDYTRGKAMELSNRPVSGIFIAESISTQNDDFGQKLETLCGLIVTEINGGNKDVSFSDSHPVLREIEKTIVNRLGMKVSLVTNEHIAAILPFYSNTNHIFVPEFFRGQLNLRDQNKLLRSFDGKKGTVNIEKATLTGIFSEYEHPLYMNFNYLVRNCKMSGDEIAAIMLHELGHGFNACYYADRSDRTNQVMAGIAKHLMANENGDIEYIYKELSTVSPSITKDAVDKMLNGPRVVAGATWFKAVIGIVRSQMLNDKYSDTSFEQGSDSFASRFGYGKELVLALDKISDYTPEKNQAVFILAQMMAAMGTVILAALVFSLLASGAIGVALIAIFYNFIFYSVHREDMQDFSYDKLKQRYLRIRMDVVDQLKNTKLHRNLVKDLLESLYLIDLSIKETKDVKLLPNYVANFIFSEAKKTETSITDQQFMEALASNDLFIKSAELRLQS